MFRLKIGFLHRKLLPSIEDSERLEGCVNLQWWIDLTHRSPRLQEVLHDDDRPTALFSLGDGIHFEVRYQFGFIVPQDFEWTDPQPMRALLEHMNEMGAGSPETER